MKKKLTEVVCILDKSGSMSGLERDTIGGYNSMIEKQKKEICKKGCLFLDASFFISLMLELQEFLDLCQCAGL